VLFLAFLNLPRPQTTVPQKKKKIISNKSTQMFIYGQAVLGCINYILSTLFCFGFFWVRAKNAANKIGEV